MLFSLSTELLLQIFQYLDTSDVLSLRQTCTHVASLTKDKFIWTDLLEQQRNYLPLPLKYRHSTSNPAESSSEELEALVIANELVEELWLVPRETSPVKLQKKRGELLLGLELFQDRWALAVCADGFLNVWDMDCAEADHRWVFANTGNDKTTSYHATLDDLGEKILIVITRVQSPGSWVASLYEVVLSDTSLPDIQLLRTFPITPSRIIRQIHACEKFVVFSQLCSIELVRWPDEDGESKIIPVVTTQADDMEEMFTTIVSLRIVHPYIFVFKTRSVELHPLPTYDGPPLSVLRHGFSSYNFRDVHISDVETNEEPDGGTHYTLRMLASDVIQGLFYFVVNIVVPTGPHPPLFDVHLAAIYAMANHIPLQIRESPISQRSSQRNDNTSREISGTVKDRAIFERLTMLGPDSNRSASFVSTYTMGPQGIRAIWIERRRGTTLKQIASCRLLSPDSQTPDTEKDFIGLPQALDGIIIYSFDSYDLREDLTHCALGEVSGKILLGNRSGEIFILETGV